MPDSCSYAGTVALRWSPEDSTSHSLFYLYFRYPPYKRQCLRQYLVPDWEIVSNFNPMAAAALFREREIRWTTLPGAAVRASVPDHECIVVWKPPYTTSTSSSLWARDPECFIAGEIHRHLDVWDKLTQGLPNRGQIMGWIEKKCVSATLSNHSRDGLVVAPTIPASLCQDCFITTTPVNRLQSSSQKP